MRDCPSRKIGYSSYHAAVEALLETHRKSGFTKTEGPQNIYRCSICDQYHLTSHGTPIKELNELKSSFSDRTQNQINRWLDKHKGY